jgi:hypothetical protein
MGVIAGGLRSRLRVPRQLKALFLDAAQVRALLAVALAPGSWLTGLAVPGVAEIEAIRTPAGGTPPAGCTSSPPAPGDRRRARLVLAAGAGLSSGTAPGASRCRWPSRTSSACCWLSGRAGAPAGDCRTAPPPATRSPGWRRSPRGFSAAARR